MKQKKVVKLEPKGRNENNSRNCANEMTNPRKKASYGMLSDGYGSLHILSSIPVLQINLFHH